MFKIPRRDRLGSLEKQRGYTLIAILSWLTVMVSLVTAMVYAAKLSLQISQRELVAGQCYAASKGIARSLLAGLADGKNIVPNVSLTLDGIGVTVRSSTVGGQQMVSVESVSQNVSDTIHFTYDTISHRILAWQDNGPGLVE